MAETALGKYLEGRGSSGFGDCGDEIAKYVDEQITSLLTQIGGGKETGLIRPGTTVTELNEALANETYVGIAAGDYEWTNPVIPYDSTHTQNPDATMLTDTAEGGDINAKSITVQGVGNVKINTPTGSGRKGLAVYKRRYIYLENLNFYSEGSKNDGLGMHGVYFGGNQARWEINKVKCVGYSGSGYELIQHLDGTIYRPQLRSCGYGMTSLKNPANNKVPTSILTIGGYIEGCNRGWWGQNLVGGNLFGTVFEGCGTTATSGTPFDLTDHAALVFHPGTRGVNCFPYFEANNRNSIRLDSEAAITYNPATTGTPPAADIETWNGVATGLRGNFILDGNTIGVRNLVPLTGFDLKAGDLTVPTGSTQGDGTSTFVGKWGGLSAPTTVSFGPTTSGTFTSIYSFASGEFAGTGALTGGQARAAYLVFLYVGETDRSKFSGLYVVDGVGSVVGAATPTITKLAGTLETGAIQMGGTGGLDIQINVTDASNNYGRRGKMMLWKFGPLG